MPKKIVTFFNYPPIPVRDIDWGAYYEDEEEKGCYGWGPTEQAAIADFLKHYGEEDENETD